MASRELSLFDHLRFTDALLKRILEIEQVNIQKDLDRFKSLTEIDSYYLAAYWGRRVTRLIEAACKEEEPITLPIDTLDAFENAASVVDEYFGTTASTASKSGAGMKTRLASFKRLVADRFAREYRDVINKHEITSPIEQLFLMEWQFADVESRLQVDLEPQAEVVLEDVKYRVDYLITSKTMGEIELALVVELDGHDFHERTKEQVAKDNKRTRALTKSGMTVLRFSGQEVMRGSRECVKEVITMIEKLRE